MNGRGLRRGVAGDRVLAPFRSGRGAAGELRRTNLERKQNVHHLLAVARLLNRADLALTTVADARLGDLGGLHGIVTFDVLRPHDAGNDQFALLSVDADLLPAFDHEVAVGEDLRHDAGNVRRQRLGAIYRTLAVVLGL